MELHVCEVLEQDVVRLVYARCRTLELLARQNRAMGALEFLECVFADHDAHVLQPHHVDALMDGRDELDHRERLSVEHLELIEEDQRHRAAVPEVLAIGDGVALEQPADAHVLVPLGDPIADVTQRIRADVDAAREQAIALLRSERSVVPDDVLDRLCHQPSPSGVAQVVDVVLPVRLGETISEGSRSFGSSAQGADPVRRNACGPDGLRCREMTRRTKEELVAEIRADRQFWQELVDEVGDRMDEPGPMGDWTFQDLAAHLAGWRNHRIEQLEAFGRGEPLPPSPWPAHLNDDDTINDWIRERSQGRSLDDVLADYDGTFERLAAALETIPTETLADPNASPWAPGTALLDIDFTDHLHEEHLPSIRAWLDTRPSS